MLSKLSSFFSIDQTPEMSKEEIEKIVEWIRSQDPFQDSFPSESTHLDVLKNLIAAGADVNAVKTSKKLEYNDPCSCTRTYRGRDAEFLFFSMFSVFTLSIITAFQSK